MIALCQREGASCGACCGLYNLGDFSRPAIRALLDRQTAAVAAGERTPASYARAAAAGARAAPPPLFPSIRVCGLLGWLDEGRTRVGCLAHPRVAGIDLRDAGAYCASTCETFLCPSHSWLSEEEAWMVADLCAGDPWLYGLVVTDVPFVRAALGGVARLAGARVERRHLAAPAFRGALRRLLALKEELRPGSEGLFGAFRPGPGGEPEAREIDYASLSRARSPHGEILLSVGADPRSGNDLDALEEEVEARLRACAAVFPAPPAGGRSDGRGLGLAPAAGHPHAVPAEAGDAQDGEQGEGAEGAEETVEEALHLKTSGSGSPLS